MPAAAPAALALQASACSGPFHCTAALRVGDAVHLATPPPGQRTDLAVLVRDLLRAHGIAAAALGEIRLDVGPGSYVGLRVAVTFGRVLARFSQARLLTCTSLELIAAAAVAEGAAAPVLRPVLDARRGRCHTAALTVAAGRLRLRGEPAALTLDELTAAIGPDDLLLAAPPLHATLAPALPAGARLQAAPAVDATMLFAASLQPAEPVPSAIEPLYLMGSYADPV